MPTKPPYERSVPLSKRDRLPDKPGVYFFLDAKKQILYIGKATSLRDRVKSYFSKDLAVTRGPKIVLMIEAARYVGWQETDSVLEALLLESQRIKTLQPPYNTDAKDDKSYNHVVVTDERFPRVLLVRGRDMAQGKFRDPVRKIFGPFPAGSKLKEALKIIRKIFPYRDTCTPGSGKPCFNCQIGLCPGVCRGDISPLSYRKIVRHIEYFFAGKKREIVKRLESDMKRAARDLRFEEAAEAKHTLFALLHIHDIAVVSDDAREIAEHRIEAYDVAHLGGRETVGVMTVLTRGRIDKSEYRQFVLRGAHAGDDPGALREILERRLRHTEWLLPDVVVLDGGRIQLEVGRSVFRARGVSAALVSVVKDERHQPREILGDTGARDRFGSEILLANSEAHRFSLALHRRRRGKAFLG